MMTYGAGAAAGSYAATGGGGAAGYMPRDTRWRWQPEAPREATAVRRRKNVARVRFMTARLIKQRARRASEARAPRRDRDQLSCSSARAQGHAWRSPRAR